MDSGSLDYQMKEKSVLYDKESFKRGRDHVYAYKIIAIAIHPLLKSAFYECYVVHSSIVLLLSTPITVMTRDLIGQKIFNLSVDVGTQWINGVLYALCGAASLTTSIGNQFLNFSIPHFLCPFDKTIKLDILLCQFKICLTLLSTQSIKGLL